LPFISFSTGYQLNKKKSSRNFFPVFTPARKK